MRKFVVSSVLLIAGLSLAALASQSQDRQGAPQKREPALLQDYIAFTVTAPPAALGLDSTRSTPTRTAFRSFQFRDLGAANSIS